MPDFKMVEKSEMLEKRKSICFTQRNNMPAAAFTRLFINTKYTGGENKDVSKNTRQGFMFIRKKEKEKR